MKMKNSREMKSLWQEEEDKSKISGATLDLKKTNKQKNIEAIFFRWKWKMR